jgi:hypothetical protein
MSESIRPGTRHAQSLMMQPGKEMDAKVAEYVFGDRLGSGPWPAYSTDLGAAWKIVDATCDEGYRLQLSGGRSWVARFYKSVAKTLETRAFERTASTPAEAICLAALEMNGGI